MKMKNKKAGQIEKKKKHFENLKAALMGQDPNLKESRTEMAIKRARKIYEQWDHASPAKEESSTTVFLLVEEILKYAEPCKI